jgi:hypothetical protein
LAIVTGWEHDGDATKAIATYLVGLLASAISTVLEIRSQIENTDDDRLELVKNVYSIVGAPDAPLSEEMKSDERNPWIAEGLWHLCLFLAKIRPELHPPGELVALQLSHVNAKDHGFDVLAIYRTQGVFGVSVVETKAYKTDPNGAVGKAAAFFKEVDAGKHDLRLRQAVASMCTGLSPLDQSAISPSLWKSTRTYIPNPHYDNSISVTWTRKRQAFNGVSVPAERIVLMPHAIQDFSAFFDRIGTAMQEVALELTE